MSKTFVNIALSLDGYLAPEGMTMEHWDKPDYKNWGAKWGALMTWVLNQQYLREKLKLGSGGETGPVNDMIRRTFERTGASRIADCVIEQITHIKHFHALLLQDFNHSPVLSYGPARQPSPKERMARRAQFR